MNSEKEESHFVNFSKVALENLKQQIQNNAPAKGGYFVFTEHLYNENEYICVYLVRNTTRFSFAKENNSYAVAELISANVENLEMACRINLTRYLDESTSKCLYLYSRRRDLSNYFYDWLVVKEKENSQEYTEKLYQIVNTINPPTDETGLQYSRDDFLKMTCNHIKDLPNKIVVLSDLSNHFYKDANFISDFAEEKNIEISSEFKPHHPTLKKFEQIYVKGGGGIQLRFSRSAYNDKVILSEEDRNRVIIEDADLARAIRQEIN